MPWEAWEKGRVGCEHQPRTKLLGALEVEMHRAAPSQTPGLLMATALIS